jgi:methyl-accepting chemotaxis protein
MKIRHKLGVAFSVVIAAMLGIAAVSLFMLTRLSQEWTQMSSVVAKRGETVLKASAHLGRATLNFKNFIYRGGDYARLFEVELDALEQQLGTYRSLGDVSNDEKMMLDGAASYMKEFRESMEAVKQKRAANTDVRLLDYSSQSNEQILGTILEKLTEIGNQRAQGVSREINRLIDAGRKWLVAAALAALVVAVAVAVSLARSITAPLAESVRVAGRVAAGDLSGTLAAGGRDEAGQLMNALGGMNAGLARIVGEVRAGAHAIADSVAQLVAGNEDLSRRTESQAASLEEASSSMEELAASVTQTADNARKADQVARATAASAEEANRSMGEVVDGMQAISGTSKRVADITGVIDSIAFQTNILALNAAVEAARAGQHGRGFGVVASEVRALAQRCAEAAKEIRGLIADSGGQVERGTQLVSQVSERMAGIASQATQVSAIIAEISRTATEQSDGAGQVTQTVAQLERVTQQNAALVEEASAATTALSERAERLADAVSIFRLSEDAPAALPSPTPV